MKARFRSAVGLQYDEGNGLAPTVVTKGELLTADQIVKIAQSLGIPVVEKSTLARSLSQLELEQEIPADLYEAVAVILAEVEKKQPR